MDEARKGLAQVRGACAAALCRTPASPAFACAVCGCGWCSSACQKEDIGHPDLCHCVAADAAFLRASDEHPCIRLMRARGEVDDEEAAVELWTNLGFSPAVVLVAQEVLRRRPSLMGELARLPPDAVALALCHTSFVGSLNTDLGHLPPHMVRAAAFCREVLLHHRQLIPRISRSRDGIVGRSVLAFAFDLLDRQSVDARLEDVLLPLVQRLSKDQDQDWAGLGGGLFRTLVKGFCVSMSAPSFGPRHWTLLAGVVKASPDSARAFFRVDPVDDSVIRRMVAAVQADPRLVPLLNSTVRAGDALFRQWATAFLADPPGSRVALAELVHVLRLLTLIAHAFPKVGVMSDARWFDACTRLLMALPTGLMLSRILSVLVAAYALMVGTDPARCAAAVEPLVRALAFHVVEDPSSDTSSPSLSSPSSPSPSLAQLLNRALARAPADASFPDARTALSMATVLRAATPDMPLIVPLARLLAARRQLGPVVLAQLTPFAVTPLIKRICGILEGAEDADDAEDAVRKCERCGRADVELLQLCSLCRGVRYCSRECQTADWGKHRPVCDERMRSTFGPTTQTREAAVRCACGFEGVVTVVVKK